MALAIWETPHKLRVRILVLLRWRPQARLLNMSASEDLRHSTGALEIARASLKTERILQRVWSLAAKLPANLAVRHETGAAKLMVGSGTGGKISRLHKIRLIRQPNLAQLPLHHFAR